LIVGPSQSFEFVSQDADVCGVDEAGRGPLAGPVVAAAVVLDRRRPIDGLRDSKLLTELQRARLAGEIRRKAKAFAVGFASHQEIDGINILQASLLAMERAVLRLAAPRFAAGEAMDAASAVPVYLRDKVALKTSER